jgi:hypothetical protein
MTHENNQNPDDLNWMEIAREDAINDVRHSGQRLPFIAAAVSLLIIGGGAVFAQTSNEAPAQAEEISVTQTSQTSTVSDPAVSSPSAAVPTVGGPAMTPGGIPVIPNVAPGVGGYDDDDDEDEDNEYEDDDDHDDDHEDNDHDEDEDDD